MTELTSGLGLLSIILSVASLYLVSQIYSKNITFKITGRSTLWKIIVVVISFVVIRRVTAFMIETGLLQDLLVLLGYGSAAIQSIRPLQVVDRIIDPLIVDSMLIIVFYSMYMLGKRGKK